MRLSWIVEVLEQLKHAWDDESIKAKTLVLQRFKQVKDIENFFDEEVEFADACQVKQLAQLVFRIISSSNLLKGSKDARQQLVVAASEFVLYVEGHVDYSFGDVTIQDLIGILPAFESDAVLQAISSLICNLEAFNKRTASINKHVAAMDKHTAFINKPKKPKKRKVQHDQDQNQQDQQDQQDQQEQQDESGLMQFVMSKVTARAPTNEEARRQHAHYCSMAGKLVVLGRMCQQFVKSQGVKLFGDYLSCSEQLNQPYELGLRETTWRTVCGTLAHIFAGFHRLDVTCKALVVQQLTDSSLVKTLLREENLDCQYTTKVLVNIAGRGAAKLCMEALVGANAPKVMHEQVNRFKNFMACRVSPSQSKKLLFTSVCKILLALPSEHVDSTVLVVDLLAAMKASPSYKPCKVQLQLLNKFVECSSLSSSGSSGITPAQKRAGSEFVRYSGLQWLAGVLRSTLPTTKTARAVFEVSAQLASHFSSTDKHFHDVSQVLASQGLQHVHAMATKKKKTQK